MAKVFFGEDWTKWTPEELYRARARLAGFVEGTPDSLKLLREVRLYNQGKGPVIHDKRDSNPIHLQHGITGLLIMLKNIMI